MKDSSNNNDLEEIETLMQEVINEDIGEEVNDYNESSSSKQEDKENELFIKTIREHRFLWWGLIMSNGDESPKFLPEFLSYSFVFVSFGCFIAAMNTSSIDGIDRVMKALVSITSAGMCLGWILLRTRRKLTLYEKLTLERDDTTIPEVFPSATRYTFWYFLRFTCTELCVPIFAKYLHDISKEIKELIEEMYFRRSNNIVLFLFPYLAIGIATTILGRWYFQVQVISKRMITVFDAPNLKEITLLTIHIWSGILLLFGIRGVYEVTRENWGFLPAMLHFFCVIRVVYFIACNVFVCPSIGSKLGEECKKYLVENNSTPTSMTSQSMMTA